MEFILGTGFGAALTILVFLLIGILRRKRARRNQAPPFRRRGGGATGVREPRRPLVPAGSAAAAVPQDVIERVEHVRAVASEANTRHVVIRSGGRLRRSA